jgi:segregation and condensation protein B
MSNPSIEASESIEETPADGAASGEDTDLTNTDRSEGDASDTDQEASEAPWAPERLDSVLEAMLFASPDSLSFRMIRKIIPEGAATREEIRDGLTRLIEVYAADNHGVMLMEIAGGYQFQTRPEFYEYVQGLVGTRREEKITRAALETLAIIAYKQPLARSEVDAIRGVGCGQLIRILMDKKLVKVVGREELPGRPFLYGTTTYFLEHFGLRGVKDLPKGDDL